MIAEVIVSVCESEAQMEITKIETLNAELLATDWDNDRNLGNKFEKKN